MLCKATMHAFAHRASLAARAPAPTAAVQHLSRGQRAIFARSGEGGVQDLIGRDRKQIELTDAFEDTLAAVPETDAQAAATSSSSTATGAASTSSSSTSSSSRARRAAGPKPRRQRQADMAQAADAVDDASTSSSSSGLGVQRQFKRCKQAIDAGLEAFQAKQYNEAIELFNLALELPGNGAYRLPGSPREYSCPSDAEEHAALYNMACCYAQLGAKEAALTCLESILETGFTDVQTITSDPDLRPVQGAQLQAVINKYTGIGGVFNKLLKKNKEEVLVSDDNKNKPWIMW